MNGLDQKYESMIIVVAAKIRLLRGATSRNDLARPTYRNQPGGYPSNNECPDRRSMFDRRNDKQGGEV